MGEATIHTSPLQWLFANNWPIRIWLGAFTLGAPLAALSTIDFSAAHAFGWLLWLAPLAMSLLFAMSGYSLPITSFLRAVTRSTSGTLRSVESVRRSFSLKRDSRFMEIATGVFGLRASAAATL